MYLTSFTDYGLRALMRLAGEPARLFTTGEMADELEISRNHLTKIVRRLAQGGFIETHRGAGGGFRLAAAAASRSLGAAVRCLDADQPIVECFAQDGGACTLTPRCRLKGRLLSAREAFYRELDKTSLADCAYPNAPMRRRAG